MSPVETRFSLLLLVTLSLGCELGVPAGSEPFRELNTVDMADQPKLKPQRSDIFGTRGVGLIPPPPGAVAVGSEPYPYTKEQANLAGANLKNPLAATPEVLARGEYVYLNYCQVCHGATGAGDGPLTKKFPAPPHLARQVPRDYTDGRLYHNPMRGQNSMPSHSKQLDPVEIWSVVHHVRKLQAGQPVAPPTEADLAAIEKKAREEAIKSAPPLDDIGLSKAGEE